MKPIINICTFFIFQFAFDTSAQVCLDLPDIDGSPGTFVSPADWSIWNSSPDIIVGNGVYPIAIPANITDVDGISLAGGEMAFFLINSDLGAYTEGITTQLSGLVPGTTYFVSIQWQQVTLDYAGVSSDPSGGRLGIYLDGAFQQIYSSSGGVNDTWQIATYVFIASSTSHVLGLKGELLENSSRGAIVVDNLPCPIILGLDILSFDVYPNEDDFVEMEWEMSESASFDYLEIERSRDLQKWITIASSQNNRDFTSNQKNFLDEAPFSGTSYYRLKEVDFDGEYNYSEIRSIEMTTNHAFNIVIFPNPGSESIIVSGVNNASQIVISDLSGRIIDHSAMIISESMNSLGLDVSALPRGTYFIDTPESTQIFIRE
jgi:hypothetical protein